MNTSKKSNKVLNIVLFLLLIISLRVWHLCFIQKEQRAIDANRPRRRTVMIHPKRGIIYDRFHIPLALNRVRYNATIYYSHIRQIPMVRWKRDDNGKKIKIFPRKEYINNLSQSLGATLNLDPNRIEDLIHAKASLLPHVPFIIKENIEEEEYFKLRMLQRDWPGLHAEINTERFYPYQKMGASLLGYLGAISQNEYLSIAQEIHKLKNILEDEKHNKPITIPQGYKNLEEVKNRYANLINRSYKITDLTGKAGLEKFFDEQLRGFYGKKTFEVDIKGNFLKELDNEKKSLPGQSIVTTLSLELQEFAESLLIEDEKIREGKSLVWSNEKKQSIEQKQPWIKGGAIIAMEPKTGNILAMASYPSFNPNDFIFSSNPEIKKNKQKNIHRWLETDQHIANIWEGKEELKKDSYRPLKKQFFEEKQPLTWAMFLHTICYHSEKIQEAMEKIHNIKNAISLQEDFEALLYFSKESKAEKLIDMLFPEDEGHIPIHKNSKSTILNNKEIENIKKKILPYLRTVKTNKDKLFIIDLCRLVVHSPAFSDILINNIKDISLSEYWDFCQETLQAQSFVKEIVFSLFHTHHFQEWKEKNQKDYLQTKRKEEKTRKIAPRPYIDYLDKIENVLFEAFWQENRIKFLMSFLKKDIFSEDNLSDLAPYFTHLFSEHEKIKDCCETLPIKSTFFSLKKRVLFLEKQLAYEFLKTPRPFSELTRPLLYGYNHLKQKEPLEKHLAASFYPRYGFGYGKPYAYSQAATLGSIFKIVTAYTALKQQYEYLAKNNLPMDKLNPLIIIDNIVFDPRTKKHGGFAVAYSTGNKPYPRFYKKGRLPRSSHLNIGKIDLASALEQSSNPYFSILAGDYLQDSTSLLLEAKNLGFGKKTQINLPNEFQGQLPSDIEWNKTGLYSFAIGQHAFSATPLQAAVMLSSIANGGKVLKPNMVHSLYIPESLGATNQVFIPPQVQQNLFLPPSIREMILKGLDQVISAEKGNARSSVINKLRNNPQLMQNYKALNHQMVGKTSTAEFMYNPDAYPSSKPQKYKEIWFGAISFPENDEKRQDPELVVIVYLKFGSGGKEAAPLAMQMIHKYREIKNKHDSL